MVTYEHKMSSNDAAYVASSSVSVDGVAQSANDVDSPCSLSSLSPPSPNNSSPASQYPECKSATVHADAGTLCQRNACVNMSL